MVADKDIEGALAELNIADTRLDVFWVACHVEIMPSARTESRIS